MLKRFIIFLVRKKLGLRIGEKFQFTNQNNTLEYYYFLEGCLMKYYCYSRVDANDVMRHYSGHRSANCPLNFLLSDECQIKRYKPYLEATL